ncbi:hypothetical protein N7449_012050 [Penicillium cf. viridicatum]|uniref:Uncharacterized protein n=1 Tax=Penicillium cf. viridicatum TaxID=2972119 RepID=A0A9W9IMM9_9EURO|nr:hypothetical protein N7449_012050 [Penicillium cf. viridicatum]
MARSGSALFVEYQVKIARILLADNNKGESVISTDSEGIGGSACLGASWLFVFHDERLTSPS